MWCSNMLIHPKPWARTDQECYNLIRAPCQRWEENSVPQVIRVAEFLGIAICDQGEQISWHLAHIDQPPPPPFLVLGPLSQNDMKNLGEEVQCPDISYDLLGDLNLKCPPNIIINQPQLAVDTNRQAGKANHPTLKILVGTGQGHWADDGRPHPATISIFDPSSPTRATTHISYNGLRLSATLACSCDPIHEILQTTWFLQDPVATSRPHPKKPVDSDLKYFFGGDNSYIRWGKLVFHCHFI